jgi:hypothetical protein
MMVELGWEPIHTVMSHKRKLGCEPVHIVMEELG